MTPEVTVLPRLLPPLATAKHAENDKSKVKIRVVFIQCQCFHDRRGVYLVEKGSVFIRIRVFFWPEIGALGLFLNFVSERMRPLNTQVPPPPPLPGLFK